MDEWLTDFNYYRLEGKEIVPCTVEEWGQSYRDGKRRIAETIFGKVRVSTVFLGIRHHGGMFETMIFGGEHDQYTDRVETYDDAVIMHRAACRLLAPYPFCRHPEKCNQGRCEAEFVCND